jgi:hypothetical protein
MRAIGLGRRMREPIGYRRITMASSSLWVTGPETAVELNMIIIGTIHETGTTGTIATTSMIATETGTTITTMIMSASDA